LIGAPEPKTEQLPGEEQHDPKPSRQQHHLHERAGTHSLIIAGREDYDQRKYGISAVTTLDSEPATVKPQKQVWAHVPVVAVLVIAVFSRGRCRIAGIAIVNKPILSIQGGRVIFLAAVTNLLASSNRFRSVGLTIALDALGGT
jgi:hypothetical protein